METTPRSLDLIRQTIKDAINCASRFSCLLFSPHRSRSTQVNKQNKNKTIKKLQTSRISQPESDPEKLFPPAYIRFNDTFSSGVFTGSTTNHCSSRMEAASLFFPVVVFLPFCFYSPLFPYNTKRGVFDIRLGRVRFARVLTKLYIPHTLYHINAHMQNMFLFETKWATRGAIGWGWLDGWGPRHRRKPFVGLSQ